MNYESDEIPLRNLNGITKELDRIGLEIIKVYVDLRKKQTITDHIDRLDAASTSIVKVKGDLKRMAKRNKQQQKELVEEVSLIFQALCSLESEYKEKNDKAYCRVLDRLLYDLDSLGATSVLPPKLVRIISDAYGALAPFDD